jgi:hypothetical protein
VGNWTDPPEPSASTVIFGEHIYLMRGAAAQGMAADGVVGIEGLVNT